MSIQRINIVLLHTWYHFTHSMESWVDLLWNPILQMIVFIFIASSFAKSGNEQQARSMILGMIFWNVVWVGQYAIAVGALWEIWSRSFSSLFITPLSMGEFLIGQMISGFFKSLAAFSMSAVIGYWLYHFSIFSFGVMLPLYYLEILLFSWGAGFLILSLIFRFGTEVQALSWALVFLVQPFGGVFYSPTVLPQAVRWITYLFPTTYVFESMRSQLRTGVPEWRFLLYATIASILYIIVGYVVLKRSLASAKRSGAFARMEG